VAEIGVGEKARQHPETGSMEDGAQNGRHLVARQAPRGLGARREQVQTCPDCAANTPEPPAGYFGACLTATETTAVGLGSSKSISTRARP
jgi:hypothetical protein